MTTYEELLTEVRQEFDAFSAMTAKKYVPKLWEALKNENPNLSREDLRARLDKDCLEFWKERTILEMLPDEAKDQKKQKVARLSQKKRISAAETAAPIALRKKEIMIDTAGKPIENDSTLRHQTMEEEDRLRFEFSIPIAQIRAFITKLEELKEDMIWFDGEFDKRRIHVISVNVREKSLRIIEEWLQKCEQNQ